MPCFPSNAELVRLYWDIGRMIDGRQRRQGWGQAVIPRLARELRNELPEIKGFSERNIGRMIAFYRAYPRPSDFLPQPAAKLSLPQKMPQAAAKMRHLKKCHNGWRNYIRTERCSRLLHNCPTRSYGPSRGSITSC